MTPIRKIVVVGAGTSGWLAASAIQRNNPDLEVTVVHDSTVPTIGVGETLTFSMPKFMREVLGLDDDQWMAKCQATYKSGVKWANWKNKGSSNQSSVVYEFLARDIVDDHYLAYHPVFFKKSVPDLVNPNLLVTRLWYSMYCKGMLSNDIDDLQAALSDQYYFSLNNKSIRNLDGSWISNPLHGHSYHYNAEVVSNVVGELVGKPCGVKEIDSRVVDIVLENESIKTLKLANGTEITGDLFIDCSGFKRLLMSQLPNKWLAADEYYNNSAIVKQVFYDDVDHPQHQISNSTTFSAMESGWRFSVPLQNRSGNGYIFNKRITPDVDRLVDEFNNSIADNKDCRLIQWEPGHYQYAVVNNCLSLGLSLGFSDPFDANNLTVTIKLIETITKMLGDSTSNNLASIAQVMNSSAKQFWEDVDMRVKSALRLSSKTDTEYYRIMADAAQSENLLEKFIQYIEQRERDETNGWVENVTPTYPTSLWASWSYTTLAMRYGIDLPTHEFDADLAEVAKHYFATRMAKNKMLADRAPHVRDFYREYFKSSV
jgi:tryptophan halogenase